MARRQRPSTDPALAGVLDAAAARTRAIALEEAARFELAAAWAEAHPAPVEGPVVDELGTLVMYGDQPATLAGEGAPGMSEFAVAEFAAACGMSTWQGRGLIGAALEAKYRLPRLWKRVLAGEVAVWKARRVTDRTHRLDPAAAAYVDAELAPILHACSYAQIERAVAAAEARADDEHAELDRIAETNQPFVTVHFDDAHMYGGRVPISGLVDYPTALAFEQTLQTQAAALKDQLPDLGLDGRRALALGHLGGTAGGVPGKEIVVYLHHTPTERHGILDVEGLGATTREALGEWCAYPATRVTLRPVLDLDAEVAVDRYEPTPEQREQAILTCPTCVFPGCARTARGCDLDHIVPYAKGGATTSWNLAPLCRLHHRLKTLGFWTYHRLTRTSFDWVSPAGRAYPVDLTHKRRRTR
jgi:5-methylcytosine-specific restriction endonuclease McrA